MTDEEPSCQWHGVSPRNVVHAATATIHGDAHAGVLEDGGEAEAGELAALVRVEDLGLAVTSGVSRCMVLASAMTSRAT